MPIDTPGSATVDAPGDAVVVDAALDAAADAAVDTPPPKLWVFVTDAGFAGGFGVPSGARATADIKCQDMYSANFTARGCANPNIHAVIQIDDTVDSLARIAITFPIPRSAEVLRATDETPVAPNWDTLLPERDAASARPWDVPGAASPHCGPRGALRVIHDVGEPVQSSS